ncbi:phosphate ABC transporter substrate-binding protein, PhoT family [Streptomyces sp. DvalAA-14]|uniref:PstS family phosphate ABC transporter substrate-binding protein n=1 Tax=unclassified Streptomyces TaxID=2593676 RepID=UPI00081B21F9|nr:substrate-binding domain-containing protein [Streptomyces sp. DvalAA-14]SCD47173.1 phosphate ABC transporter substrate-binding protein, PhoT family [Streptomyces sp. DvalAA-14]
MDVPWEISLAVLGLVVPIVAALYEFAFNGRKRLGYRVQMDTTVTDLVHSEYAGALQQLRLRDGRALVRPSFVLLRIENNGVTNIDTGDYATLDHDRVGITVEFPGRRVAGLVITELSAAHMQGSFGADSGLGYDDSRIFLPRVPMNRSAHYKVLAALESLAPATGGDREEFPDPQVNGGVKGGVGSGQIQETRSRTGISWRAAAMVLFLAGVIVAQLLVSLNKDTTAASLDCAGGKVTLSGSTAFAPVLQEASATYRRSCPGTTFVIRSDTSGVGIEDLERTGREQGLGTTPEIAFSDGPKDPGHPEVLQRPIAFLLFTLVINKDAGVQDLTLDEIRKLYAGQYTNWRQLHGNDVPIKLVSRDSGSGTRHAFEERVLDRHTEPGENSTDCQSRSGIGTTGVIRCRRSSTGDLLDTVAATPGALGYSELGSATARHDLLPVRIDGQQATLEAADNNAYPFWATEYANTYGEPRATALTASFLRYLTSGVGQDIVRSHGDRPCAELANPVLCRPS